MRNKKWWSLIMVSVLAMSLTACGGKANDSASAPVQEDSGTASEEEQKAFETLNVGTQANYIGAPAYYALEKGYFKDAGLDVNLIIFDSGAPINEALAAKEIDVGQSGFASIYSMTADVCTWVQEVDNAYRQQTLFCAADSPILQAENDNGICGSADTVKGLTAVCTTGTTSQFHAEQYAAMFGLQPSDITELSMDFSAQYQAFVSGQADLISASGVSVYQIEDAGFAPIGTFEDIVGLSLCDGITVRNDVLEARRDEIVLYVGCIQKAMDELGADEDLRFEYLKKFYADRGQDIEDSVLQRLSEDTLYMTTEVIGEDGYALGSQWADISDFLLENGKIDDAGRGNVEKNIDASLLSEATGISF